MKLFAIATVFSLLGLASGAQDSANPLGQVLSLLDDLANKVKADGEKGDKGFHEYFEWCDDTANQAQNEIKTLTSQKAKLEAKIAEHSSAAEVSTAEVSELAGAVAKANQELKSATAIRANEADDFVSGEKELIDVVDTVGRAISVLEREMEKNPAAFAQVSATNNLSGVLQALSVVTDAAAFSTSDRAKLTALVQAQDGDQEDDDDMGAPDAAKYKSQSGNVVEVLEDMKEKAEAQLSEMRKEESNAKHNFEMLKQSLEDKSGADNKDLANQKTTLAEAQEGKATAEGELEMTSKTLKDTKEAYAAMQKNCMRIAADHEATIRGRTEELTVIGEAKKILAESTGGAAEQVGYSLVQLSSRSSKSLTSQVASLIDRLAREHHSAALAQLASRVSAVVRYSSSSSNGASGVFDKVKGLINDLVGKLEAEAQSEATEKAFCDEELAKTAEKKDELQDDSAKLLTKAGQAVAKSAELKQAVAELQAELAKLAKAQAEAEQIRGETHDDYVKSKADLEQGLGGVRRALDVLRDYYARKDESALLQDGAENKFNSFMQQPSPPQTFEKAEGAGSSIVGILEVVESDFAKELTAVETEESDAADTYAKNTQEFKITKTEKEQDVKFKTQTFKGLDKTIAEIAGDLGTVNAQLGDVLEYDTKLKDRCVAKPESYEQRKARRAAEIEGLKQALAVLEGESAFIQQRAGRGALRHHGLRGSL